MLIKLPQGHAGLHVKCRCDCNGTSEHVCFNLGSPTLRGYCAKCFEARVVDPHRQEGQALQNAFAREMSRINGWRLHNEGLSALREVGGPVPRPSFARSRDEDIA